MFLLQFFKSICAIILPPVGVSFINLRGFLMNIKLRTVSDGDAQFLSFIMNTETILNALNEQPTQLEDWVEAIKAWREDNDEEDYIISDGETPIGWIGINNLESTDKIGGRKLAAILPDHQSKGIGYYAITRILEMLKQRNYLKVVLYTDRENHKAGACYRKCGFEVTETFMEEMRNGKTVARCKMELTL